VKRATRTTDQVSSPNRVPNIDRHEAPMDNPIVSAITTDERAEDETVLALGRK